MNKFFIKNSQLLKKEISSNMQSMSKKWTSSYPWAKDALTRLEAFVLPGKMIRGQLVVLAAQPKNKSSLTDAVHIGAALEMMHSGILIHDDIMDRDLLRRGLSTIHTQYKNTSSLKDKKEALHFGESMASCVAIVSYFIAMGQFGKLKNTNAAQPLLQLFSEEMAILGFAQMDDVDTATHFEHNNRNSVFRIYEQKTGRYTFGIPLLAGFLLKGVKRSAVEKTVFKLAQSLGVLFQLRDDMLGVVGDSSKTGKSVGGDIRERKQTWLYFELVEQASKQDSAKVKRLYASGKPLSVVEQKWVLQAMKQYLVLERAEALLLEEQSRSVALAKQLPFAKIEQQALLDLISYLVTREK